MSWRRDTLWYIMAIVRGGAVLLQIQMYPVIPRSTATLRQRLRPTHRHRLCFDAASTDEALRGFGSRDVIDMFDTQNIHPGNVGGGDALAT